MDPRFLVGPTELPPEEGPIAEGPRGWAQGAGPRGDGYQGVGPKALGGGPQMLDLDPKEVGPWGVPRG